MIPIALLLEQRMYVLQKIVVWSKEDDKTESRATHIENKENKEN